MLYSQSRLHKKFTEDEDRRIKDLVRVYGDNCWSKLASFFFNRCGRQLKERWFNYLAPNVNKDDWTPEEEELLLQKLQECGKKWRKISCFFKGRTDVHLKNRFRMMKRRERLTGNIRMQTSDKRPEKEIKQDSNKEINKNEAKTDEVNSLFDLPGFDSFEMDDLSVLSYDESLF